MRLRHKIIRLLGGDHTPHKFDPDWRVPPGETLREVMESMSMTSGRLATDSGLSLGTIQALLDGTADLTPDVALRLEWATGIKALFWTNLESHYRRPISGHNTR